MKGAVLALVVALASGCSSNLVGGGGGGGHAGDGTAGTGGQAIPGTDGGVFACGMSVEQVCARLAYEEPCDLTWSAVQTDTSLCTAITAGWHIFVNDCLGYHVLGYYGIDSGTELYYDGPTGALVAILNVGLDATPPCAGGPTAGFAPPSGCTTTRPLQCTGDAGRD